MTPVRVDPEQGARYARLEPLPSEKADRTDEHRNDELVEALVESVLLAVGARAHADADRALAEADMAAGAETLPPA